MEKKRSNHYIIRKLNANERQGIFGQPKQIQSKRSIERVREKVLNPITYVYCTLCCKLLLTYNVKPWNFNFYFFRL